MLTNYHVARANFGDIFAKLYNKCSTCHINWIYPYPPHIVTFSVPDPDTALDQLEILLECVMYTAVMDYCKSNMSTHNYVYSNRNK